MKAAVFGANGYIGHHLVYYLDKLGWQLTCYDIHKDYNGIHSYYSINITDSEHLTQIKWDYDFVFFFMGLTGTKVAFDQYKSFIDVNEKGLLNVLNSIKDLERKPKIVFPSTRLVYKGIENTPLKENADKEFKTIYASSKYNGELYLEMYKNMFGIDYSIFRICVPYGNLFDIKFSYGTIGFFLERALNNEPITLFGDGNLKRTFTHVLDICKQIAGVSVLPESSGECFNIDGETYSLKQVAELIATKHNVAVSHVKWPDDGLKLESGDTIFNAQKIKILIPDSLQHSLEKWINL